MIVAYLSILLGAGLLFLAWLATRHSKHVTSSHPEIAILILGSLGAILVADGIIILELMRRLE